MTRAGEPVPRRQAAEDKAAPPAMPDGGRPPSGAEAVRAEQLEEVEEEMTKDWDDPPAPPPA